MEAHLLQHGRESFRQLIRVLRNTIYGQSPAHHGHNGMQVGHVSGFPDHEARDGPGDSAETFRGFHGRIELGNYYRRQPEQ